jgi:hypothetical protein
VGTATISIWSLNIGLRHPTNESGEISMAKGMEQKKETKKKPAKTMKEKKAEKNAKKSAK